MKSSVNNAISKQILGVFVCLFVCWTSALHKAVWFGLDGAFVSYHLRASSCGEKDLTHESQVKKEV